MLSTSSGLMVNSNGGTTSDNTGTLKIGSMANLRWPIKTKRRTKPSKQRTLRNKFKCCDLDIPIPQARVDFI